MNFASRTLSGTATLSLSTGGSLVDVIVLDTRDLSIFSVEVNGFAAFFTLEGSHGGDSPFGSALTISGFPPVPPGTSVMVYVKYSTSPQSTALQWLEPDQTSGKKHPYLFSQCQAIHARSMLPCVDAPGNKSTYTATVRAPAWSASTLVLWLLR